MKPPWYFGNSRYSPLKTTPIASVVTAALGSQKIGPAKHYPIFLLVWGPVPRAARATRHAKATIA